MQLLRLQYGCHPSKCVEYRFAFYREDDCIDVFCQFMLTCVCVCECVCARTHACVHCVCV